MDLLQRSKKLFELLERLKVEEAMDALANYVLSSQWNQA